MKNVFKFSDIYRYIIDLENENEELKKSNKLLLSDIKMLRAENKSLEKEKDLHYTVLKLLFADILNSEQANKLHEKIDKKVKK